MPQGYGKPVQNTRPTPYRMRQDLGYVPSRAPQAGGSDGSGSSGGGIIISGGNSPTITSSRVQVQEISTTTHTLTNDDLYTYMVFTNAAGCVVTVPTDAAAVWDLIEILPVFAFEQGSAGQVTIVGDIGVTVNTLAIFKLKSFAQFAVMQLIETAPNVYTLFGAQEPV
jgi:hypothetical protein